MKGKIISRRMLNLFLAVVLVSSLGFALAAPVSAEIPDCTNPQCVTPAQPITVCAGTMFNDALLEGAGVTCDPVPGTDYQGNGFTYDISISYDFIQDATCVNPSGTELKGTAPTTPGTYVYHVYCVKDRYVDQIWYDSCSCCSVGYINVKECVCSASDIYGLCVGDTKLTPAELTSMGSVTCTGDGCAIDHIDHPGPSTYATPGAHPYTVYCYSQTCGMSDCTANVYVDPCEEECECYAPDVVICEGDPVDDDLFIDAGAMCTGECDMSLVYDPNLSLYPGDHIYTVDCDTSVSCDGTVTVLPACTGIAPPLTMCQYGSLPILMGLCSEGCDQDVNFDAVKPSIPDCYPYTVTCTDPCGGPCGGQVIEGTICVLPCVGVEIIEAAGVEKYESNPGDPVNEDWKDCCDPEGDRMIVPVSSTYGIKAVIENCSGCILYDVTPYITIQGPAERVEGMPDHWNLGNMEGGDGADSTEVAWTLHCTGPGMVEVTVWVNDCALDTVCFDQRIPGELVLENCTSDCEVCVNCEDDDLNDISVDATVRNIGQTKITNAQATIDVLGPPYLATVTSPLTIDLDTVNPGDVVPLHWDAECDGVEGTATFEITVIGYDICGNKWITPLVCTTDTFQRNVLVDVCVEKAPDDCGEGCVNHATVSRLQQFYVKAVVRNCTETQESMTATLILPQGTQLVSGSLTVPLPNVCPCCTAEPSWLLQCIAPTGGPVPVEVVVNAFGKDYSNFPCDPVTVTQEEKVHLSASMDAFVLDCDSDCMVSIEVVAVCQDYDVKIWVTNSGEAVAENVMLDINVEGPTSCADFYPSVLFIDDKDDGGNNDPDIPGGATEWAWLTDLIGYDCHCDCEGDVVITISNLTATDENTCAPVLEGNVEVPCPLVIPQCDIDVEIVNPKTCENIEQWEKFAVKARVTNCGDCEFEDALVTLMWDGAVQLVAGSQNPAHLVEVLPPDIDCEEDCRYYEATWMVQCVGAPGDVVFDVCLETMTPHLQMKTDESVTVHQIEREQAHVCVDILSPDAGSKYATSQDFAITAVITNLECCAPITITEAFVEVNSIPWWEDGISIGDPLPPLPWVIGPGEAKTVTWTAHCESSSLDFFHVVVMGESDEYEPVYATSDCVNVWQYPAAHLEVDITDFPTEPIVTSTVFEVTANITNTGEADATEVIATLSVEPEGSVRVAGPSEDGYTKYIGTLPGHDSEASWTTVTWNLHCKMPCDSTITITVDGNDEYGWHMKQQCASTGSFIIEGGGEMVEGLFDYMPAPPDLGEQRGWFAGFFYGDANGLIGPFNATSPVSWAAMGGGPDYMGEVALMGAVIPNVSLTNAAWWLNCCCSDGEITCPCACELIEGRDVMVFIGHITSDTEYDNLPMDQEFYGVGPGLLQIINGQLSGSYLMHECGGMTWVKSLLGGEYCTNMAAEASRAIEARFIEPDSVTVKQLPMLTDLGIVKVADDCCYEMGEVATFTITLNNIGPSDATSVLVMDVLPAGLSYDGSTASQGWYDVTSGYWSVGDLASGADATLEIDAVVNTVGEVCNRATVVALDQHDPVTTNNSSEVCINATEPPDVTGVPLYLDDGLNLISLPLIPDTNDPQVALAGVNVGTVNQYVHPEDPAAPPAGWVTYINGTPYNPATGFVWDDGIGYWAGCSPADVLNVTGVELQAGAVLPPSYDVYGGWNLIGFKSATAKLPTEYLAGIDGKYVMVYGYDNGSFHAVGSPGHAMLVPGFGYWLAVIDTPAVVEGTIFP
jgi:uncharacterized repeat protein (TIGR01451 family)